MVQRPISIQPAAQLKKNPNFRSSSSLACNICDSTVVKPRSSFQTQFLSRSISSCCNRSCILYIIIFRISDFSPFFEIYFSPIFRFSSVRRILTRFCLQWHQLHLHPSGGITRAKKHQLGIKGEVKSCEITPEYVKRILQDHFDRKQAAKDAPFGPATELPMQTPASAPAPLQNELGSLAELSPMPISFAIPAAGEFSATKRDDGTSNSIASHFTHHAFTVNSGEDVAARISLLALDFQFITVLSGSGTISSVTIGLSDSCSETSKYEGTFDLLSLTGSFEPNKGGLVSGKLTVSLAIGGRVIQGPLAGSLVAAGPVKVVVASFCPPKEVGAEERQGDC